MKEILFALIRYTGLPFCFREILQRNRVTIVLFHDISPKNAEVMFGFLKKNYSVISLQEFLDNYYARTWNFPKKPLVITFDDGHKGNYALLPLIKKLNIPVTIFLCAGIVQFKTAFLVLRSGIPTIRSVPCRRCQTVPDWRRYKKPDLLPRLSMMTCRL